MIESNYPKELMKKIDKENKLFDDQLIECAKNNFEKGYKNGISEGFDKGRLDVLKDEEKFLLDYEQRYTDESTEEFYMIERRLSQIQKEIKGIEQ
jgi:flagellar biosynthesis/type III secretory pathway protein FliH